MSATFKNAKKKLALTEFRRLINEQKGKQQKEVKKIESPLAKYNDSGQLTCVLCKTIVKSETVWPVHLNSKQHRENVEQAKKLKERTNNFTTPLKRPLTPPLEVPEKKLKSILKNSSSNSANEDVSESSTTLPEDFFDSKKSKTVPTNLPAQKNTAEAMEVDETEGVQETIPEGFFDDPKLDAKARNQEYKDPVEEEWEKFQREIREADSKSAAIIAEDQEEATNERQIDEIEEQMKKLSRVLDLEKKKETLITTNNVSSCKEDDNREDDENEDFDEYLDWRSKKVFK